MPKLIDLLGRRFGRWLVLSKSPRVADSAVWLCRCDCGTTREVKSGALLKGQSNSCGCLSGELAAKRIVAINRRHGLSRTRTHGVWCNMKSRCLNPNVAAYRRYGGRGIKVCDRWLDFDNFLADMGECPSSARTIERRNNDGPYDKENCYWADWSTQQNNRSTNRRITFRGETLTLAQWAVRVGIKRTTIARRLDVGWPIEKTLTTPRR